MLKLLFKIQNLKSFDFEEFSLLEAFLEKEIGQRFSLIFGKNFPPYPLLPAPLPLQSGGIFILAPDSSKL